MDGEKKLGHSPSTPYLCIMKKEIYVVYLCDPWKTLNFRGATAVCTTIPNLKKILRLLIKQDAIVLEDGFTKSDFNKSQEAHELSAMLKYVHIETVTPNSL